MASVPLLYVVIASVLGALSFFTNVMIGFQLVRLKSELRVLREVLGGRLGTAGVAPALLPGVNWAEVLAVVARAAAAADAAPASSPPAVG